MIEHRLRQDCRPDTLADWSHWRRPSQGEPRWDEHRQHLQRAPVMHPTAEELMARSEPWDWNTSGLCGQGCRSVGVSPRSPCPCLKLRPVWSGVRVFMVKGSVPDLYLGNFANSGLQLLQRLLETARIFLGFSSSEHQKWNGGLQPLV